MNWILNRVRDYFQSNPKTYSILYKSFFIFIALFSIYYIVLIAFLPVINYRYILPEIKPPKSNYIKHDLSWYYLFNDSLIDRSAGMANKEAFLLARIEMAKNDSIGMTVDLKDSTISLIVQGVSIYQSRITSYKSSKLFDIIDPFVTAHFFSWPFKVKEFTSSVPKIPVIIRKAPKDTIEAASRPEPGQLEESQQYISFQLKLDRKINLIFEQDNFSDTIRYKSIKRYSHQQKKVIRKSIRSALIRAGPVEFIPEIKLRLDRQAALVIFRALPENANIVIRINPN